MGPKPPKPLGLQGLAPSGFRGFDTGLGSRLLGPKPRTGHRQPGKTWTAHVTSDNRSQIGLGPRDT